MTVHLVTFSDDAMECSRRICATSALKWGADEEWQYERRFMEASRHVKEHPEIFLQPANPKRAWGWWAWKPIIIEDAMRRVLECFNDGEHFIVYADAGIEFIDNVSHIIERMDQDIFLFRNNWEHAHWCKRDVVDAVWPNPEWPHGDDWKEWDEQTWVRFGKQVQASVIFFRVSEFSRKFVKEWLDWCLFEGGRLIDDSPSRTPNHPEFREHRHDQAVLTTMACREGIRLHWWPARYNMDQPNGGFVYEKLPQYAGDTYPCLFSHHRKRNHEWESAA